MLPEKQGDIPNQILQRNFNYLVHGQHRYGNSDSVLLLLKCHIRTVRLGSDFFCGYTAHRNLKIMQINQIFNDLNAGTANTGMCKEQMDIHFCAVGRLGHGNNTAVRKSFYLNGFAFKPSYWQDLGKPVIKIKEMGNGVTNETPRNSGERVPAKYLIKTGDLLFSWSATLMVIIWSGEEGWLNQHLFKVTPVKGIDREFLLQSISNTIVEFQNLTTGSTMKHIQRNKLDQVFVNVPNAEIMKRYSDISEKTRSNILSLQSQLRLLTEARNRLLPKLMSGAIIH